MVFLSPGVKSQEIDYSTYVGQISSCIVGMVGGARKGKLNYPTLCTSPTSFVEAFGYPIVSDYGAYCAIEFLKKGNQLFYVRVADDFAAPGKAYICDGLIEISSVDPGTYADDLSVTFKSTTADEDGTKLYILTVAEKESTKEQFTVSLDINRPDFIEKINSNLIKVVLHEATEDIVAEITDSSEFIENTSNQWAIKKDTTAENLLSASFTTNTEVAVESLKVVSDTSQQLQAGQSIGDVIVDGTNISISFPADTFNFGEITAPGQAEVPAVPAKYEFNSYGDNTEETLYAHGEVEVVNVEDGKTFVRILSNTSDNEHISQEDADAFVGNIYAVEGITFVANQGYDLLDANGNQVNLWVKITAQTQEAVDAIPAVPPTYAAPWTKTFELTLINANGTTSKETIVVEAVLEGEDTTIIPGTETAGATTPGTAKTQTIKNTDAPVFLTGGNDGCPISTGKINQGLQFFRNAEELDVNLIACPGRYEDAVVAEMIAICQHRTDCIAIIDPPQGLAVQDVIDYHNGKLEGDTYPKNTLNTDYAAIFYPWVKVYDIYTESYIWLPPSGDVLAAFAYSDSVSQPWFAAAGLNRGMLDSVLELEVSLDEGQRDALYGNGNAINAIVNYKRQGIAIWGNKTLQRKTSATDRINVRRMVNMVRKAISATSSYLIFEQNEPLTWRKWKYQVDPYLESIKSSRGLVDYRTQMDEDTVTELDRDQNRMPGKVWLKPTKAAEFIELSFILTSQGAQFES